MRDGPAEKDLHRRKIGCGFTVGRATARAHSRRLRSVYIWQDWFLRVITVPGYRDRCRDWFGRRSRDAANLFSPSLEISDDVWAYSFLSCSGEPFRPRRESREIYQRAFLAHIAQYIFKRDALYIHIHICVYTRVYGIVRRDGNLSLRQKPKVNVPSHPKNTPGEHPPRLLVRAPSHWLSRVFEKNFTSGEWSSYFLKRRRTLECTAV